LKQYRSLFKALSQYTNTVSQYTNTVSQYTNTVSQYTNTVSQYTNTQSIQAVFKFTQSSILVYLKQYVSLFKAVSQSI